MKIQDEKPEVTQTQSGEDLEFSEIAQRLLNTSHGQEIRVSEFSFLPYRCDLLASKIQAHIGKTPLTVQVRVGDNFRTPQSYLIKLV